MVWAIVAIVIGLWLVVYLMPDIVFHHLQWGGFQGRRSQRAVGLTFDDGPGPDTDGILETLADLNVRATFFVIAERALRRPETVLRLVAEGHEVGLHMRRHVSAFLMWPWQSYRDIVMACRDLEQLTGKRPTLFRPPWGHVNLGTRLAIRRLHLMPVFWNIAPDDWRDDRTPETIAGIVVRLSLPGTMVVLHDAGGDRTRTRKALPLMVEGLRALNLEPVPVRDLAPEPSFVRRIWTWWEIRFTRGWEIDSVPNAQGGDPILRLGKIRFRGPKPWLANASSRESGAWFGEIHFGNPALADMSGTAVAGLKALRAVMRSLSDVALMVETHPKYQNIEAVGGVTLLDAATAIQKLGFRRFPVSGWTKWSMWIYLTFLMAIYHRQGWRTLKRVRDLHPVRVVMSKDELLSRYGSSSRRRAEGGATSAVERMTER